LKRWASIGLIVCMLLTVHVAGSSTSPTFEHLDDLFLRNTYLITGEDAHYIDILGCVEIGYAITRAGNVEEMDMIFDTQAYETGNIISLGGPAVNPVTEHFNRVFGIEYVESDSQFEICCEGRSLSLDRTDCQHEGICIIYLGREKNRNVMLVWGYGWRCTYAGAQFLSEIKNWQFYAGDHMVLLRWRDSNMDGLVQTHEIHVEESC